ncbi:MAG: hypothetical protein ACLROY_12675 [Mediterraneibacter sp.]
MFGKQGCYLCGGKLENGRCTACGLDNAKNVQKKYRLNESSRTQAVKISDRQAKETSDAKAEKTAGTAGKMSGKTTVPKAEDFLKTEKNTAAKIQKAVRRAAAAERRPADVRAKRYVGWIIAVILIITAGMPLLTEIFDLSDQEDREVWSDMEDQDYVYDEYQFVTRELSESGEIYDALLGNGEYCVGVNLPEGSYTVELADGEGSLNVDDPENSIYLYQYFGYEEDYNEVTVLEDVRLYEGAVVSISGAVSLDFHSENAQTQAMSAETNPLTESVTLEADRTYTAGVDFPEGIYDISGSDWVTVEYSVYLGEIYEEDDLNYQWENIWFEEGQDTYRNAVLPAGAEITADGDGVALVPSPIIGSQDYDGYYDRYR